MDINMSMNMFGTPQEMAKMKAQGVKFPINMNMVNNMDCSILTGHINTDQGFPTTFKYNNFTNTVSLNGQEVQNGANPLVNQQIYAKYDKNGTFSVDSISGKTVDDQSKGLITNMLQQLINSVKFPDKPIHIGETFTQVVPMQLPLKDMQMKVEVRVQYKLIKLEGDHAFFDIVQSAVFKFDIQKDQMYMVGNATGGGNMVYGINESYPLSYKSNLQFTYNLNRSPKQTVMKAVARMSTEQQTQITAVN